VRLLLREPVPLKQEVEVGLLAPGLVREVKLIGKVMWVIPAADGQFCVGIGFEKRLSYTAVQELAQMS
jgi:hypothetical protein